MSLFPFKLGEFDLILEMDWLSEHEMYIYCKNKKAILKVLDKPEVVFQGRKQMKEFLTMIQARRLLR